MEKTGYRAFLKTAILMAMTFLLLGACLCSCVSDNNEEGFKQLLDHFTAKGLKITQVGMLRADAVHADAGITVKIEGREIGIYKFDTNHKKQKERLEKFAERGFIGVAGHKFGEDDMAINGTFVMIDFKGNPQGEKILAAFKSF